MAEYLSVHLDNPQPRSIQSAVAIIQKGGVVAYPTDTCYALGCHLGDKAAVEKMRRLRQLDDKHHLTLMCRNLAELATYARVDNWQYRLLKSATPGAYTFILPATKEVPRRLQHPKKNTIGLRIPNHTVVDALLEVLGEPLLTTTLLMPGESWPPTDGWTIYDMLGNQLDAVIDAGACGMDLTTVVDLSGDEPVLVRAGVGDLTRLGL